MKLKKDIKQIQVSFKELMIRLIFYGIAIQLFSSVFTKEINFEVIVCLLGGIIVGTPLTYYFVNDRSFKPIGFSDFVITILFVIPVIAFFGIVLFSLIENV